MCHAADISTIQASKYRHWGFPLLLWLLQVSKIPLLSLRVIVLYCCCSIAKSRLTLCNPMDCSMPGFPVLHHLWEFAQKSRPLSQRSYLTTSSSVATLSFCSVCVCVRERERVAQSCLPLCNPNDCSLPGSSVHGTLQARILEWVATPFFRGSSQPRN